MSRADSLGVAVPAGIGRRLVGASEPVDLDQPDSALHQAAGEQHALAERSLSIEVAVALGLILEAKRSPGLRGAQQIERPAGLLVERSRRRLVIEGFETPLEVVEQTLAATQPAGVELGGQVDLLDPVTLRSQPGVQEPGVGRSAQEPRVLARPDAPVGVEDPVRQRDGGR